MVTYKNRFLCLACNDYDKEIDILCTQDKDFKYHVKRKITPNLVKFFDMKIIEGKMKILSTRDEEFFVDIVDLETHDLNSIRT